MDSISDYLDYEIDENGCWVCTSHLPNKKGYAYITINGQRDGAHRHSFRIHNGEIAKGQVVRHTCDVRLCVNPSHLILGTNAENVQDRVDRSRSAHGQGINTSKLTDEQVEIILRGRDTPASFFANLFEVHSTTIYRIRNGLTWAQTITEKGLGSIAQAY
ncbi:HNH endonuclease signature motif containing protein [Gimesia fumaroli]|uniref:HNH nuclease domain-containing protein n=1 Tax=Gimesia fumaroli TaxID=2527976 RepID=A0A518IL46_9PLAN|nr:HNH endonuclease signature motif containing protein [Gimesia fumaroli]QDV53725.1 hypothetical protein Enr17x_58060 [Gimesia fumaroli]